MDRPGRGMHGYRMRRRRVRAAGMRRTGRPGMAGRGLWRRVVHGMTGTWVRGRGRSGAVLRLGGSGVGGSGAGTCREHQDEQGRQEKAGEDVTHPPACQACMEPVKHRQPEALPSGATAEVQDPEKRA